MAAPFLIYFAGVGTVVAALGIGFGGGWVLSSSEPNGPRGKPPTIAKQEPPPLSSTPVTVRTPDENKAQAKAEEIKRAAEPSSVETSSAEKSTEPRPEPATDGRASPGANWVAMPPETTGPATATTPATTAPVRPLTSPLTPPPASPETAAPATAAPSAPTTTVTVRRGSDPTAAEERVTVKREPGGRGSIEIRVADESKPDRKLKQADPRKSGKSRAVSDDDGVETVVERVVETNDQPVRPPPPAMRDAGSLRGD